MFSTPNYETPYNLKLKGVTEIREVYLRKPIKKLQGNQNGNHEIPHFWLP